MFVTGDCDRWALTKVFHPRSSTAAWPPSHRETGTKTCCSGVGKLGQQKPVCGGHMINNLMSCLQRMLNCSMPAPLETQTCCKCSVIIRSSHMMEAVWKKTLVKHLRWFTFGTFFPSYLSIFCHSSKNGRLISPAMNKNINLSPGAADFWWWFQPVSWPPCLLASTRTVAGHPLLMLQPVHELFFLPHLMTLSGFLLVVGYLLLMPLGGLILQLLLRLLLLLQLPPSHRNHLKSLRYTLFCQWYALFFIYCAHGFSPTTVH